MLRLPHFVVFSVSQAVSLFGDKLDYMALLAMIAFFSQRFGWQSARAISFLSVVVALPTIIFGPVAGVLVDRWDRRKVMVLSDSARVLLVLAVPVLALATNSLPLVYALAFGVFLAGLLFHTARLSIIPNMVGPDHLLGANSVLSLTGRGATFLGMLVGGLIVDWSGWSRFGIRPSWTAGFYLDSLTYLLSVIALLAIFRRLAPASRSLAQAAGSGPFLRTYSSKLARLARELREGGRLMFHHRSVLFVNCSVLLFVFLGAAAFVLYIPIVQSGAATAGLGMGTRGVGLIAAVGAIGLVLSSTGYGIIGHRLGKQMTVLCCFIVLGLVAIGLALSRSAVPALVLALIAGLALSPISISMDTLLHESVPETIRGRAFSNREWLLHLAFALCALIIGQLTRLFAPRPLLLAAGILAALASSTGLILVRRNGWARA